MIYLALSFFFKCCPGIPIHIFNWCSGTHSIITIIFSVTNSTQNYLAIKHALYFTSDATGGGSALNRAARGRPRSNTSVRLSHLGCLLFLMWLACSPSVSFHCITLLSAQLCSAPNSCIDLTSVFPWVPVHNFTSQVIKGKGYPLTSLDVFNVDYCVPCCLCLNL